MKLVLAVLLFFKVTTAQVVLYQPQNTVSVNVNSTAVILCMCNDSFEAGTGISWYVWRRSTQAPVRVKSCLIDNDKLKYECKSINQQTKLEIYNIRPEDSGMYYCMFSYTSVLRAFGNGTALIVEDKTTIHSPIYLLASGLAFDLKSPTHLVCLVRSALHTVHVTWNISGIRLKGRVTSMENPDGTWTIQNLLALPLGSWDYGDHATCEIWFSFSAVQVHRRILNGGYVSHAECSYYVRNILVLVALLIFLLIIHLSRTCK